MGVELRDGRAQMRGRVVPERHHARVTVERRLYDAALYAASSPMNHPDLAKACGGRRVDVLGHDRGNVARGEGVEIDLSFDGNADGIIRHGTPPSPPF